MPSLLCSADDKNEIRGSHIDNPDAEREDTNNAQTRPRFFPPLSCLSLRSMEARGHHAKPSGRTLSPPLIPVFWSTFSGWARIPNSECRGRCNNNHRDSARTDSYSPLLLSSPRGAESVPSQHMAKTIFLCGGPVRQESSRVELLKKR